jgi:hypothetical protein
MSNTLDANGDGPSFTRDSQKAQMHLYAPGQQGKRIIHSQRLRGRASDGSQPATIASLTHYKMFRPPLLKRMKQWSDPAILRISSRHPVGLVQTAIRTL